LGLGENGSLSARLALTFPKKRPGALALLLEEAEFRKLKKFHIGWFEEFTHTNHLLGDASEAAKMYEIHNVYANLTRPEQDFWDFLTVTRLDTPTGFRCARCLTPTRPVKSDSI